MAIAGDDAALATVFEEFRPRLRKMVLLRMDPRIRRRVDASDVLQEAYVDLARRLPEYAGKTEIPFFLWVRFITGTRLDQIHRAHLGAAMRDAGREVSIGQGQFPGASTLMLASQLAGEFTAADERLIHAEIQEKLEQALNAMDDHDREILALRHFEEMSTEEIAAVVGLTRSGVLKRHTRAVRRLGDAIKGRSEFDGMS